MKVNQHPRPAPVLPADPTAPWAEEVDVVVVGSGGSGATAALMAAEAGAQVLVLEKAATLGGTTYKSGGGVWIPNNRHMRQAGINDPRDQCLRYLARTARPHLYAPDAPNMGLAAWEFELLETFYDNGADAIAHLEELGIHLFPVLSYPNYYSEIEEDKVPTGRTVLPATEAGEPAGGPELIRQFQELIEARGGRFLLEHAVTSAIVEDGRVIGVSAATASGDVRIRARRGVVFASGGFTHNRELRDAYLAAPIFGGGAVLSNEGDFVAIAASLGAAMRNMNESWNAPVMLEPALALEPDMAPIFNVVGTSILAVNRYGRRAMNEKAVYHDACAAMTTWDPVRCEYPNLLMFAVWDQRNLDTLGNAAFGGGLVVDPGPGASHVLRGETLEELADLLADRVRSLRSRTGGVELAPDFAAQMQASVTRFNELAEGGVDEDFQRGESAIQRYIHGVAVSAARLDGNANLGDMVTGMEPTAAGDLMAPLSATGPYYGAILAPGTLDTKGGPMTDRSGQVLDHAGAPIAGLYAVGNCAGSPTAHAYWGAGATLGPMITFAWLAGQHVASQAGQPANS